MHSEYANVFLLIINFMEKQIRMIENLFALIYKKSTDIQTYRILISEYANVF